MGLDFHRSLFQIIFHLLVSERTYSDCENQLYFDVIERFLWIVYYVLSILAIAAVMLCYGRFQRAFGGFESKGPKPIVHIASSVDTSDSTIQTSEGWAVVYHQNDELRTRANIQHRRLKKVISEISNKRVHSKQPVSKPIAKVSRWRQRKGHSKPSDGCIKMLLDTKQQLLDRLAALPELYSEAIQQKKDLKCALSISENQLFQNNRDAQLNWIQWQAAQRTIAETTTKALKMKTRLGENDYDPVAPSDDALSTSSSLVNVDPVPDSVKKRHDSSGLDTSRLRHRNPTGDAGLSVCVDDTPCADGDIGDSHDKPSNIRVQVASNAFPDRLAVTLRAKRVSPSCLPRRNDSPERRRSSAGNYLRGPSPSMCSDRQDGGSACERMRSSFSADCRVGVVCGMAKAADIHVATAAVLPERRATGSPERLAKALDAVQIEKTHDYRRRAVSPECRRCNMSPERRRVAVVPECPRLHTAGDRRRLAPTERHHVGGPVARRPNYPFPS